MKKWMKLYWLYLALLVLFALVRMSPYSVGTHWDEAINDIAIGGFASVLVALFLQIKDDYKTNRKNSIIANRLFYPLISSVFEYMDLFPFASCFHDVMKRNDVKTFSYWNEYFCDNAISSGIFDENTKEEMLERIDAVKKNAEEILSNQAWYLAEGVFTVSEIEFVKAIRDNFSLYSLWMIGEGNFAGIKRQNDELLKTLCKRKEFSKLEDIPHGYDYKLVHYLDNTIWKKEIL